MADIMSILQVELYSHFAEPDLAGVEIRQCRSDQMAGQLDRPRCPSSAGLGFDHQGPRLPRQCDLNELGRRGVSKGLHHHQEHISHRRFQASR